MGSSRQDLTPYTLSFDGVGTAINAVFPAAKLLTTFKLDRALGIVGFQMASSMTVAQAAAQMALFMVVGSSDANINLGQTSNIFAAHLANVNNSGGLVTPANQSTVVIFQDSGIKLPPGNPVSLYGCAANNATEIMFAVLNLYTILIK